MSLLCDDAFFDRTIERHGSSSRKWDKYAGRDVLPFWIADMDFAAPASVLDAIRQRLDHPILGYSDNRPALTKALGQWLQNSFAWTIDSDWVVWLPGVVPGLNLAALTLEGQGSILIPTPVYYPFLEIASDARLTEIRTPMASSNGHWEIDFDRMATDIRPDTRMLLICNPQNPTGRCYTREELSKLAEFVEQHDLLLVCDEIHCSIILDENSEHHSIASEFPHIKNRTVVLYAMTKTYNIPALSCAAAVIPDAGLRKRFLDARVGIVPSVGPLELIATLAALEDQSNYVPTLLGYLRENLALVAGAVGPRLTHLEGTYLAWIDVQDLAIGDVETYFESFGLGLSPGNQFGKDGYVRFNFACPQHLLHRGLDRLTAALNPK